MAVPPITMSVTINQRDIDRIEKRLDKWQGKELALRMEKATRAGMNIYVGPLKGRASAHNRTGKTQSSIKVRPLKKRYQDAEVGAFKVGPTTRYRPFAIAGTSRGIQADPYVEEIQRELESRVSAFIDEQVRRLA